MYYLFTSSPAFSYIFAKYSFEINGTAVNQVTDPDPHGGGFIGLRSMQGVDKVSYDDFKVWSVSRVAR